MKRICILLVLLICPYPGIGLDPGYEQAPIFYSDTEPTTPLTEIRDRIANGEDLLAGETDEEILLEMLDLLGVPRESQVLVYSKTSAQNSRIAPQHPRAIYFSDNAYVGWVQNGSIEVTTFDRKLGMVFHLVDLSRREKGIRFHRDRSCLNCHGGSMTRNWPGLLVRSVYPSESGQPIFHAGTHRTDHSSPIEERWGGWYVTGQSGEPHMGNMLAEEAPQSRKVLVSSMVSKPVATLDGLFPTEPYPSGGSSDIVALMILEHQVAVHNALVEGNLVTRQTMDRHRRMKQAFGEPVDSPLSETNRRVIQSQTEQIVRAMLFADEYLMKDSGVEGGRAFQEAFANGARKDSNHRSLRDLRLYERLFKYRCSHLIYSDAFAHLPDLLKHSVLDRLRDILQRKVADPEYQYLSASEREKIDHILSDTLPAW